MVLLLQPEDEHIIVIADEHCGTHYLHNNNKCIDENTFTTIRYGRFKYTGECVAESKVTLDLIPGWIDKLNNQLSPVDHEGAFRMTISPSACLRFDENLFKFTEPQPATHKGEFCADDSFYWWKDVLFVFRDPEAGIGVHPVLAHKGTMYVTTSENYS